MEQIILVIILKNKNKLKTFFKVKHSFTKYHEL